MAVLDCFYDSEVLGGKTALRAILPEHVPVATAPVFYLLHGLDGTYLSWYDNTKLEPLAARYGVVIIMPDAKNSFYTDTVNGERYYTQITREMPRRIEHYFGLRGERHIAGISMGGHGAYKIALLNPEDFVTVGSFSGVLDLVANINDGISERKTAVLKEVIGEQLAVSGTENDLFDLARKTTASGRKLPRFYQFCGTEDFLYDMNRKFRDLARQLRLDLTYLEGPGDHTWPCWARQIEHYIPWAIGAQF